MLYIDKAIDTESIHAPSFETEINADDQTINSNNNNNSNNTSYIKNNNYLLFNFFKTATKKSKFKDDNSMSGLTTPQSTNKYISNANRKKRRSLSILNFNGKQRSHLNELETHAEHSNPLKTSQNFTLRNNLINERSIYSDPKDNYKRRTLVVERKTEEQKFGFDIQSYGLFNMLSKRVEYIFYLSNITTSSPAHIAGLKIGDVLLAINGIRIDKYKDLNEIKTYFKERFTVRLIVLSENISKKLEFQKQICELEKKVDDKLSEYESLCKQEEMILRKYQKFIPETFDDDNSNTDSTAIDDNLSSFETDLYLNINGYKRDLMLTSVKLKQLKSMYYSKSTCSSASKTSVSSISSLTPPNTPSFKYTKNPLTNSNTSVSKTLASQITTTSSQPVKSTHFIQNPTRNASFNMRTSTSSPSITLFQDNKQLNFGINDDSTEWVTTRL